MGFMLGDPFNYSPVQKNSEDNNTTCSTNEDCEDGYICESGNCVEKIQGCTDSKSNEYDSSANVDNGTCISCQTGYDKDSDGLCTVCADGYTADAAGTCYEDEDEEEEATRRRLHWTWSRLLRRM